MAASQADQPGHNDLGRFSSPLADAPARDAMDEALRNHWLEMWYQPKIDLKRKCLAGAEALARICHPSKGVLWPQSFLPGASEESFVQLTEHALRASLYDWSLFADCLLYTSDAADDLL